MSIEIRPATLDDAEAVLAYYTELLAEKLPFIMDNPIPSLEQERKFVQEYDNDRAILFLALSQGRVVGMNGYNIGGHSQLSHSCSLNSSIAKFIRRHGIGSQLIASGEKWCRSKSVRRLELEVIVGNPAVVFYQHFGFEIEGRKREAIKVGADFRDLIIMAKRLA